MLIMKKMYRLFWFVIILALIIHGLILLCLFFAKYNINKQSKAKAPKEIMIERSKPEPVNVQDLPTMLPGKPDLQPATEDQAPDQIQKPEEKTEQNPELENKPYEKASEKINPTNSTTPNHTNKTKRTRAAKPTFNLDLLNSYAVAQGSSAFKNFGSDRPPQEDDYAILLHQERVKKHFHANWNNYANSNYYYNLNESRVLLFVIINEQGRVIQNHSQNLSNNPGLLNLINKILKYAEPFPVIPAHLKIKTCELKLIITISQGKFSSGYGYT